MKKALDKVKQSPFKKRGNFEEEATTIVPYPKSDSKDYSHSDLPKQLMAKMFGLLKEGLFCDSVILSGNTEIRVIIVEMTKNLLYLPDLILKLYIYTHFV